MTTQTEALRFWTELSTFNYVPLYFTSQYTDLVNLYTDLYDLDQFTSDLETYIQNKLGYATTMDDIADNFAPALNTQLGFWQGTYFLFDPSNTIDQFHVLNIGVSSVSWDGQAITGYTFDAATLTFSGSIQFPADSTPTPLSLSLAFSIPAQPSLDTSGGTPDPVTWLEQLGCFQRYCSGTATLNGTTVQVHGKDGCYTPQGAGDQANCDSIDYWNGIYNASIANDTTADYPAEGLTVDYSEANSTLTLSLWGGMTIQTYQYFNNSFSWTDTTGTGQLVFYRTDSGLRAIAGMISNQGQTFYIQAFYRQSLPAPTPTTLASEVAPVPLVDTATASPIIISTTTISKGVSNRLYPAQNLVATGGTAPYTWSSSNLPDGLTLTSDGQLSGIPTYANGSYDFYVTATDSTNQAGNGTLTLELVAPLTIKTTTLPDGVSDKSYAATLVATGGDSSTYQWAVTSGALPAGFTLNSQTGQISGTLSSPGADSVSSFAVTLTSTVSSISLTCESSFTIKIAAIFNATVITSIITGILGLLFGTGVIFNLKDRYSKWQEEKKKADADPSHTASAQAVVDATGTAVQNTNNAANDKSTTATNNINDLNQGTLIDRLKLDFNGTLTTQLKAANQMAIDALTAAYNLRKTEPGQLRGQISTLEQQWEKETDDKIKQELVDKMEGLKTQYQNAANDLDRLDDEIVRRQKDNARLDQGVTDTGRTIDLIG